MLEFDQLCDDCFIPLDVIRTSRHEETEVLERIKAGLVRPRSRR